MAKTREILEKANNLFLKYGIKSVTMDDISQNLGISKKTLYQHFSNKASLVNNVVKFFLVEQEARVQSILLKDLNAIEQLHQIYEMNYIQMKELHPSVMFDIKKYFQESYCCIAEHKSQFIFKQIKNNLEKGIKEGLFRTDIDVDIISRIYVVRIDMIHDPEAFPRSEFLFSKVLHELFIYHVRGIATEKGLNVLAKLDIKF